MAGDQRAQLVARFPFDLVFLHPIEDLLVSVKADAVGGAGFSAFAANLAEVLHAEVDRRIRRQRQVGQDCIAHMDAGTEFLRNDQTVAPELADSTRQGRRLRIDLATQRRVTQLADIRLQRSQHEHRLHEGRVVCRVADVVAVRLRKVVIPGYGTDDDIWIFAAELLG